MKDNNDNNDDNHNKKKENINTTQSKKSIIGTKRSIDAIQIDKDNNTPPKKKRKFTEMIPCYLQYDPEHDRQKCDYYHQNNN